MNKHLHSALVGAGVLLEKTCGSTTYPIRRAFDKEGWLKDKKKRKASKKARKRNR